MVIIKARRELQESNNKEKTIIALSILINIMSRADAKSKRTITTCCCCSSRTISVNESESPTQRRSRRSTISYSGQRLITCMEYLLLYAMLITLYSTCTALSCTPIIYHPRIVDRQGNWTDWLTRESHVTQVGVTVSSCVCCLFVFGFFLLTYKEFDGLVVMTRTKFFAVTWFMYCQGLVVVQANTRDKEKDGSWSATEETKI